MPSHSYLHGKTSRQLHFPSQFFGSCSPWARPCPLRSVRSSQGHTNVDSSSRRPLVPLLSPPPRPSPVLPICWLAGWCQRELKTRQLQAALSGHFQFRRCQSIFTPTRPAMHVNGVRGVRQAESRGGGGVVLFFTLQAACFTHGLKFFAVENVFTYENFCITQ